MLEKLTIKNVALISSAEIEFTEGINVLSGETGAGKSVVLDCLNFVLGAKADKTLIRSGENECFVKAEFNVSGKEQIRQVFIDLEIDEDDALIVSRKLTVDGKSKLTINGQTATLSMVRRFTSLLLDVHGQSEHFSLLKNSNQLDLIDKFGGDAVVKIKSALKDEFVAYKDVLSKLEGLGGDDSKRFVRIDILNYQIDEIEKCSLSIDEEDELLTVRKKLQNLEKISSAMNLIKGSFDDEGGVCDLVGNSLKAISSISSLSEEYNDIYDRVSNVLTEIDDISQTANDILNGLDLGDYNLDSVENRLNTINNLKRKYGGTVEAVLEFLDNAILERKRLENFNELSKELLDEKNRLEKKIYVLYLDLNSERNKVGQLFSRNVIGELRELGMENANFAVQIDCPSSLKDCSFTSENGIDNVEFLFSANLGEPLKPLSAIISGGEISRFMLAIKAQTSKFNDISTFVFDEIDSGISGKTAKIVAQKFAKIGLDTQIIAITHLPQISAMADNNLFIEKIECNGKTLTQVYTLSNEEKLSEIVRLTGGNVDSDSAKKLAFELIEEARNYKNSL